MKSLMIVPSHILMKRFKVIDCVAGRPHIALSPEEHAGDYVTFQGVFLLFHVYITQYTVRLE